MGRYYKCLDCSNLVKEHTICKCLLKKELDEEKIMREWREFWQQYNKSNKIDEDTEDE